MASSGPFSTQMVKNLKSVLGEINEKVDFLIKEIANNCQNDASQTFVEDSAQTFVESGVNQTAIQEALQNGSSEVSDVSNQLSSMSLGSPYPDSMIEGMKCSLGAPNQTTTQVDGANPISEDPLSQLGTMLSNVSDAAFNLAFEYPVVPVLATTVVVGTAVAWSLHRAKKLTQENPKSDNPQETANKRMSCTIL